MVQAPPGVDSLDPGPDEAEHVEGPVAAEWLEGRGRQVTDGDVAEDLQERLEAHPEVAVRLVRDSQLRLDLRAAPAKLQGDYL